MTAAPAGRAPSPAFPADDPRVAVRVRNAVKTFDTGGTITYALHGVDFDARRGELMLLVGPSGCGKTTLLSVVAGILDATDGEIRVLGNDVRAMSASQKTLFRKANIGFVFQQYNLVPSLTAAENASVPLLLRGEPRKAAVAKARDLLGRVGLGTMTERLPSQLSGGQQQRVAIARALVGEPGLLVCDEPTAALDGETGAQVMKVLRETALAADRCVIVVTHDSRVFRFGDRIAEMVDGRVVAVREQAVNHA